MKKLNKLFAILVAMAMVLSLTVISAFAAEQWETDLQGKYADDLSKAGITKILDVPDSVTAPAGTFWFEFTPTSQPATTNDLKTPTAYGKVTFSQTESGTQKAALKLSDVFTLGAAGNIKVPGEYVFTVKELDDSATNGDHKSGFTKVNADADEKIKYSDAQYELRIYVINNGDNLKIKAITAAPLVTTTTGGTETTTPGDKVNPSITETTEGETTTIADYSDVEFTNYYTKELNLPENPTQPQKDAGVFNIEKEVTGAGDKTAKYPFTVKMKLDAQTTADEGKVYVGKVGNTEYTFTFAKNATEATANATTKNVMIGNGEKIVFEKFPAGASVEITEVLSESGIQNQDKYTQTVSTGLTIKDGTGAENKDLEAYTGVINNNTALKVTNDLDSSKITPTGILISNLPYIALALVAIGGLVAYVVVRRRQSDEA